MIIQFLRSDVEPVDVYGIFCMREYTREGLFAGVRYLSEYIVSTEQALLMYKRSRTLSMGGGLFLFWICGLKNFFGKYKVPRESSCFASDTQIFIHN